MKKAFKAIITNILGWQVRRLRKKHGLRIVAVVGSIGKTSTKLAIAQVLGEKYRVRSQNGNYNHIVTAPLVFFNKPLPNLMNPFAWVWTIAGIELQLHRPYPYDVVVLELGTDGPGQLIKFKKYLTIDLLVVTSIAPEHMEFFQDLDAVAKEELAPQLFSKLVLVNKDLVGEKYMRQLSPNHMTYSINSPADYRLVINGFNGKQYDLTVLADSNPLLKSTFNGISDVQLYSVCSAAAVAHRLSVPADKISAAITRLRAFSGRMQQLVGINNSLIIDDTYNASPEAVKAALDTLYKINAPQKIALLGNMNELGDYSQKAHTEIGKYCDPKELGVVVTIGKDANRHLAEAAQKRGCQVKRFNNPFEAGMFIKGVVKSGAVILVKGSQNGVYAEEAIKYILANPADEKLLVRQSRAWLSKKKKGFSSV